MVKNKILLIGSGGREHALLWKLAQSKKVSQLFCAPGNAGTALLAQNIPIKATDTKALVNFAKEEKIDMTFVGPEAPLIEGIVDLFRKNKLRIIGPSGKAAKIEGSKVFAKKMMQKYRIPTAKFRVFTDFQKAKVYLKSQSFPQVLKADGQCMGKGVCVAQSFPQADKFLQNLMVKKIFAKNGERVIIEECLKGQEISFMAVTDGANFASFLPSQDHKRVFDSDRGPNTGGMGAYAPVPFVQKKLITQIEETIVRPTIKALAKEGSPFQGILYPGLIITKDGPFVLEFNCRFGDPETQPVLSLLKSDLLAVFEAIENKKVGKLKLSWQKGFAVCVVLASKGYPGKYLKGKKVRLKSLPAGQAGTDPRFNRGMNIFHSGTAIKKGKIVTSGGRVLGITGRGKTLKEAIKNAYQVINKKIANFAGMQYRRDIGQKGLYKKLWEKI